MTETTFKNAVDEMLGRLDPIMLVIQQGGGEAALYSLQQQLIELMGLIERNPGIEAATGDLYGAAEALVVDRTEVCSPWLESCGCWLMPISVSVTRLSAARPLKPGHKGIWLHGNLRFAA